ncbi:MAG: LOG family protein [Conexivisphaera sp.]
MINLGVAAHSEPTPALRELALRFVSALPPDGVRLLLGGYWGAMRFVADAAIDRGIEVVFVLPLNPPAEPPRGRGLVRIDTGMDFKGRSVVLVRSSDILAALGGESGTMLEVLMAYSLGIPAVVLRSGMPSDSLERVAPGGRADTRSGPGITFVDTPEDLARFSLEASVQWYRRTSAGRG